MRQLRTLLAANVSRVFTILLALFIMAAPQVASAQINSSYGDLTQEQQEHLGIYFAKGNYSCGEQTSVDTSGSVPTVGDNKGTWNSGAQPPYILEQFMIEVLKDLAQKKGVNPQDTVTEEHIIALVAFAVGEGGDTTNDYLFNPLNTGINAPELTVGGVHVVDGRQAFKSFDAGVEGTARALNGSYQQRMAQILIKPNSTADQIMETLTYFNRYEGNLAWATASMATPDNPNAPQQYYKGRIDLVNQIRKDYSGNAALVIGTPRYEGKQPKELMPSKLQFHPTTSSTNAVDTGSPSDASATSCACNTSGNQPVIVIDPGHSGDKKTVIDPSTNLKDYDYPQHPEMEDVFDVSKLVQSKLQADGYKVIMTKNAASDTVTFRQRADLANTNKAALAISIHDQGGTDKDALPFATANNHVYVQKNGLYRINEKGDKVIFNNSVVADLSAKYGGIFTAARTAAEGHPVDIDQANLSGRPGLADGNIWMVQLFSNVPWIYNEVGGVSSGGTGAKAGGLSNEDKQKYANGLIGGVEKSVPLDKTATGNCGGSGNWSDTVKAFAWPTYHDPTFCPTTQPYIDATKAAQARITAHYSDRSKPNDYLGYSCTSGGITYRAVDCGAFVTRLFRDSNADPNYNGDEFGNVISQHRYLAAHPDKYRELTGAAHPQKPSDLQKGDIFIAADDGHTYVFVGDVGFWPGYNVASASGSDDQHSSRAPMASHAYDIKVSRWYRPLYPVN